ncbi:leukocyte elastase inhibitor-like [Physella acuta]|uniref:leukocyte elastase inhibitor-like n=1 Tax=Physella acuta TaxID=109671 RepID=UPI0027DBC53C|nr:leukocyte elastase inhibitor-like [Physella acuta]
MYLLWAFTFVFLVISQCAHGDLLQQQVLAKSASGFSQNLYRQVAISEEQIVYSPYSIHSALTMTYLGARGVSAREMSQVLGLTSLQDPHQTYHDLIVDWNSAESVRLDVCNAIFTNPYETILPSFISDVDRYYLAPANKLDVTEPERAINELVANKTHNMIPEILKPGSLDDGTDIVLVNVVFFNGTWENQFLSELTQQQDFHKLGGAISQVSMMNEAEKLKNYKKDNVNGVDVLELPFKGNRFSMYFALPQKMDGISDLENLLATPGKVDELFDGLTSKVVRVSLPKFKIETSLDLINPLIELGMYSEFDDRADFSGINGLGDIFIDKAIHKAVIDLQETGTVASAATVISMTKGMIIPRATFLADHPFMFFLRDNVTGQLLFQGKFSG